MSGDAGSSQTSTLVGLVPMPRLSGGGDRQQSPAGHPETLFGLAEKFAAVESAVFLSKQFSAIVPTMLGFLPEEKKPLVQEYQEKVMRL